MKILPVAVAILITACSGLTANLQSGKAVDRYDSEFLHWCESDGVWDVYGSMPADCAVVSRGQWDHLPISVNAEDDLIPETLEAIAGFNEQLGFTMFRFEVQNSDPDIIVMADGPSLAAARAKHATIDGKHYGAVLVYNGLEKLNRPDIILHELGHLVGLKHDPENRNSLMYPGPGTKVATLERQDVIALRAIYEAHRR